MKKIIALVTAMLVVFAMSVTVANATGKTAECTPKAAYTETVVHPPVTHVETVTVVDQSAVPAVPGFWQEFSPNKNQGPFVGPPSWPTDPRGTWSAEKTNGGPQQDASGVFQNGNGNGDWFYRSQGTPAIPEVTHEENKTVTDVEGYTETINHPAVTCTPNDNPTPTVTLEPGPRPTVKPTPRAHKHDVVTPTLVHAGL